jgi:hypothetical protein
VRDGGIRPWRASTSCHTRSRTLLRASMIRVSAASSISFNDRHIVRIDATWPEHPALACPTTSSPRTSTQEDLRPRQRSRQAAGQTGRAGQRARYHVPNDRGVVLRDVAVSIAGGAQNLAGAAVLRDHR